MKDIADKLAAIGAPISEEDQVVTLLGSQTGSYATLVTALEATMMATRDPRIVQSFKSKSKVAPVYLKMAVQVVRGITLNTLL